MGWMGGKVGGMRILMLLNCNGCIGKSIGVRICVNVKCCGKLWWFNLEVEGNGVAMRLNVRNW